MNHHKNLKTTKLIPISASLPEPVAINRSRPVFEESPFLGFAITAHKRAMTVSRGTVITDATGTDQFETTIAQVKLVDEEQFIKLFTGQVSALFDLSSSGIKMFGLLLVKAQSGIGTDEIFFPFPRLLNQQRKKTFTIKIFIHARNQ